uniref:MRN complex-interacting protein N-terminal domain-containing protein n=1 Tax=Falco tinnunculus TaxID=100819 RepID=A0A8C4UU60_FALTI
MPLQAGAHTLPRGRGLPLQPPRRPPAALAPLGAVVIPPVGGPRRLSGFPEGAAGAVGWLCRQGALGGLGGRAGDSLVAAVTWPEVRVAMARAGGGMAPQFWVLRCCSCRLFQVQQAKRSGKWSCSVCGQRQAVQKIYGQGSGLDCRHHVQKLNLLQGEAEEAVRWTSRCTEESVNDSKNIAAEHEGSSVQQEGRAQVSRWSKYLDKNSEDQEDGEEEADRERQQFCSRKNTVEEQRKHQKSFLSSDVVEYVEENGVFHLAYQAKKVKTAERKKSLVAVPDPDHGDAVSGDRMVPVVCKSVVPEENTQTPAACNKPSKWEKFLTCSDSCSGNAARATLSPQEGSGRLGLCSTSAAAAGMPTGVLEAAALAWACSEFWHGPAGPGYPQQCIHGKGGTPCRILRSQRPRGSHCKG